MKNTPKNLRLALLFIYLIFVQNTNAQIAGCTDTSANNFNASATVNDGSCTYTSATINSIESWLLPSAMSESSGLIMWNNKIWTHNDDTDINIYSLDTSDITNYTSFPLTSCVNNDWEEISQDSTYIYMGDFGNNVNGNRTNLKILRIDKASFLLNSPIIDTINFSYSTQTDFTPTGGNNSDYDCEAFIVSNDSIYLFTKDWVSNKSTIYTLPKLPGTYFADSISTYDVQGLITGASYIEDKHKLVLSGYSNLLQPFIVLLYDFHNHDFFSGNKRKISINLPFTQVEGIATVDGVNYFISNESFSQTPINTPARINRINLSAYFGGLLGLNSIPSTIEKFDIYPNPATDVLTIKMNSSSLSDLKMTIFNPLGQKLNSYELSSTESNINVSNYNQGVYYCVITTKDKFLTSEKFVKQ